MMTRSIATAFLTLFLLAGAATVLSACNTMSGLGQDLAAAGRAITGASNDVKKPD
jgi:predicted small secreted protein